MSSSLIQSAVKPSRAGELDLGGQTARILNRWPAVGLALGVVRGGSLTSFSAHGVADIATRSAITEDTVFRIASISKTFTAIAVLQLWERGLVDLDAPASEYLRAYDLEPVDPSWRPATLRHLLTHTAGIPEVVPVRGAFRRDFGESVELGAPLPSLAEHYHGRLPLVAEPGTRFRYGNHGFATLGQIVEDVTGEPLSRYFREHIFAPLGMENSDLVRSDRVTPRLATGYEMGRAGPKTVAPREFVTAGAASVYSTSRDMARYLAALLGHGSNDHGSVLRSESVADLFAPQYRPDPRIPGIGLAFWRVDLGGRAAVEHQGTLPGFHSQVFLSPDDGVAVMAFTNGSWRPDFWLPFEVSSLLKRVVGVPDDVIRSDVARRPETWGELCGWYALEGPLSDVRMRGMFGAGAEVFVRGGQLMIRTLTPIPILARGFPLYPDDPHDPLVFRLDLSAFGFGSMRVVFGCDDGEVSRVHLEIMPLTLVKRSATRNVRRWTTACLAAGATGAFVGWAKRRRVGAGGGD
jgi:CubicO group peptidase (beta-lactamase class C family)